MNALRKKWQLDRIERAVLKARLDDAARKDCFWPCVHLASSVAGSDTRLIFAIAKNRIRITAENAVIRTRLFWERVYYIHIKGWTHAEYEARLDVEFQEMVDYITGRRI